MMKNLSKRKVLSSAVILSSVLWGGTAFADNAQNNIERFELDPVLVTAMKLVILKFRQRPKSSIRKK